MQFSTGQVVVHPHHGPATVSEIYSRPIRMVPTEYLRLTIHHSDLTIDLPALQAEELGVRALCDAAGLSRLLEVLRAPTGDEQDSWTRRFKENQEKLRRGDLFVAAEVVRDLARREHNSHLSVGEKAMLRSARGPVVTELSLVLSIPEEEAESLIDANIFESESVPEQRVFAEAG